jgi:hypothetical protein
VPIGVQARVGRGSHIHPLKDGIRFLLIIFKIATLYSPLKLFVPASASFFLVGAGYYAYTYAAFGRFTNMSLLLLSAAVIIFLIGLISEQITSRDGGSNQEELAYLGVPTILFRERSERPDGLGANVIFHSEITGSLSTMIESGSLDRLRHPPRLESEAQPSQQCVHSMAEWCAAAA